jgi:predicted RNase H-like nuclease
MAVVAPVAAALERRVGERLQRRAAHRDLPQLAAGEEPNPLAVGREERTLAAGRAVEGLRDPLAERAHENLRLAVAQADVGHA